MVTKKIGFIGLGDIGMPMGQRVIAAGFDVYVWGRNKDRLKPALGHTLGGAGAFLRCGKGGAWHFLKLVI